MMTPPPLRCCSPVMETTETKSKLLPPLEGMRGEKRIKVPRKRSDTEAVLCVLLTKQQTSEKTLAKDAGQQLKVTDQDHTNS